MHHHDVRRLRAAEVCDIIKTRNTPNGGKFHAVEPTAFQIPTARAIYDSGRLTLYFDSSNPLHDEFTTFIGSLENEFCRGGITAKAKSSLVYNNSVRMTVFDNAQWFDETGEHAKYPPDIVACAVLAEFQGFWETADRWGVRLKVLQVLRQPYAGYEPETVVQQHAFMFTD